MKIRPRLDTRRAIRVEDDFALTVQYHHKSVKAYSINISVSGLLCRVSRLLPVFSEVYLTMSLAHQDNARRMMSQGKSASHAHTKISCLGVVLRCVKSDDEKKGYNTAIYFLSLADEDRTILRKYIESLTQSSIGTA